MGILSRLDLDMQHSYIQLGARNNLWYKDIRDNKYRLQITRVYASTKLYTTNIELSSEVRDFGNYVLL